jgi:hypothetical protein
MGFCCGPVDGEFCGAATGRQAWLSYTSCNPNKTARDGLTVIASKFNNISKQKYHAELRGGAFFLF